MTEVELALEQVSASLSEDPAFGRFVTERAAVLIWRRDGQELLWRSPGIAPVPAGLRPSGRLAELGGGLAPRLGFRLERLRLRAGDGPDATYACRLVTAEREDVLVTAAVDSRFTFNDLRSPSPVESANGPPASSEPTPRLATVARVRFVWTAGPDGRIASVSPELATVVGASRAAVVGRRWDELAALAAGHDRVAAALAGGAAWSGVPVLWRVGDGSEAVPVELAGAPVRAGEGATGYRGFGLCWLDRRVTLPDEAGPAPQPSDPPSAVIDVAEPGPELVDGTPASPHPAREQPLPARPRLVLVSDAPVAAAVAPDRSDAGASPPALSDSERGALAEIAHALSEPPSSGQLFPLAGEISARPGADGPALLPASRGHAGLRDDAALAVASDVLVWLDDAGRIRASHGEITKLFGRGPAELVGSDLMELLHPDDHRAALECLHNGRTGLASAEVRGRAGPNGGLPLLMRAGRAFGDEDAFIAAFIDVQRFKAAEHRLRDARRAAIAAKDDQIAFLARVSHEIRTPLNAITGFAELMLGERFGPLGSDRYRDYLRDIRQSGSHVLSLVNDLLDLAKVTSGHADLSPAPVHLNAVVSAAVATLGPLALRERTILRTSLAPGLAPVMADERSIKQVTLNVLSNAIRFSGAGGQAIVSTASGPAGDVVLRVRDTGPGMAPGEIEAALIPFRQLTTARRDDGTGLGLPLSKALVEANGGTFALTSGRGSGTLVEIRLSAARPAQPDREPSTPYRMGDPSSPPAPDGPSPDPARDRPARPRSPAAAR